MKTFFIITCTVVAILVIFFLAISYLMFRGTGTPLGNSRTEFHTPENVSVTAERALELAAPFLEESYRLRRKMRGENQPNEKRESTDWLTLESDWYYVARDDYPSYTPGYYMRFAVRVNTKTGEVVPPQSKEKF